jgi:hypothetical protein
VHDHGGPDLFDERGQASSISNIHLMVNKSRDQLLEPALVPSRVPVRAKKYGTLVVIETVNGESLLRKKETDLGANEA